jgi:hypothetical protein
MAKSDVTAEALWSKSQASARIVVRGRRSM